MEWNSKETFDDLLNYFLEDQGLDLDDEDYAEEINELKEELKSELEDETGDFSSWGDSISITIDGVEYNLVSDEDEAERIATELVKQDIEEGGMFNESFVQNYITISDTDRRIISQEEGDARVDGMNWRELSEIYEREFGEEPDEDLDTDDLREEVSNKIAEEVYDELRDPIQYFVHDHGTYSIEDLLQAPFIMIDEEEMAEDAISADGWAHFLSRSDGNYETTTEGIIVMKG